MKKLLTILLIAILFSSCGDKEDKIYTLKYVVFYPNYNDTVIISNSRGYCFGSDRGTNYIRIGSPVGITEYENSAPYKVISYTYKIKNK